MVAGQTNQKTMIIELLTATLLTVTPAPPNSSIPVVPKENVALIEQQESRRKSNRQERRASLMH